jgi:hypothetical protein
MPGESELCGNFPQRGHGAPGNLLGLNEIQHTFLGFG